METGTESIRVTLTIEGKPEEIPAALHILLRDWGRLEDRGNHADRVSQGEIPRQTEQWTRTSGSPSLQAGFVGQIDQWTPEELARLWAGIVPGAREVLLEIAKRPIGYPKRELYNILGLDGRTVGGRLSSVGAAMTRLGFWSKETQTGVEWPWSYDGFEYRVKPEVAEMIRQLAENR
jgi:hypothetical protein